MKSVVNFRQVAEGVLNKDGLKIKKDFIYRSADLSCVINEEQIYFDENIDVVYDLRSNEETTNKPSIITSDLIKQYDLLGSGKQNELKDFNIDKLDEMMISIYQDKIFESDELKSLIKTIVDNNNRFLFHCTAGKDRTGMVGIIIMKLLDFNLEDIYKEYLMIDEKIILKIEAMMVGFGVEMNEKTRSVTSVDIKYIDAFLNAINDKYGDWSKFVTNKLELTNEDISRFKLNYLTK